MVNNKLMQLRKAGVHFGHKANCLNPKMIPYIFAEKNGRHILDLIQTSFFFLLSFLKLKKVLVIQE